MSNNFDFDLGIDLDELAKANDLVQTDIYDTQRVIYPSIAYIPLKGKALAGHFAMGTKHLPLELNPPGWKLEETEHGEQWVTQRLRIVLVGKRERQIITDQYGKQYFYPAYTKKDNRPAGKLNPHVQYMGFIPGFDQPIILGLKGWAKYWSATNDPTRQGGMDSLPVGFELALKDWVANINKVSKSKNAFSWLCTWDIDLIPHYAPAVDPRTKKEVYKPVFVRLGTGEKSADVLPFVLNTDIKKPGLPDTRFVGKERLEFYQNFRREVVLEWENAWKDASNMSKEQDRLNEALAKEGMDDDPYTDKGDLPF